MAKASKSAFHTESCQRTVVQRLELIAAPLPPVCGGGQLDFSSGLPSHVFHSLRQ